MALPPPGRGIPSPFFLKVSSFLLPPGPDLAHQSVQLDDQAAQSVGRGVGDGQITRDELEL